MKKVLRVAILLAIILLASTTMSKAATEDELIARLSKTYNVAGKTVKVPNEYIKEAKRYVATYEITSEGADKVIAKIDEAVSIMNEAGQTDVNKLNKEQKNKLLSVAQDAAKAVNAKINYTNGTLTVIGEDGAKFGTYKLGNDAKKFSQTGNNDYMLYSGVGIAIIAVAGIVIYRKKTANA